MLSNYSEKGVEIALVRETGACETGFVCVNTCSGIMGNGISDIVDNEFPGQHQQQHPAYPNMHGAPPNMQPARQPGHPAGHPQGRSRLVAYMYMYVVSAHVVAAKLRHG